MLTANKLFNLHNILLLTMDYCNKYSVSLCPGKTKLLRITKVVYEQIEQMNPIKINNIQIEFSDSEEHVGVVRRPVINRL